MAASTWEHFRSLADLCLLLLLLLLCLMAGMLL